MPTADPSAAHPSAADPAAADPAAAIASAIAALLIRSNRAHLYHEFTAGVCGVDATTYPVLSGLARTGPLSTTQLADAIGLDRTVTSRYASRLKDANLLSRRPDPTDGRATVLTLTPQGERAVTTMRAALGTRIAAAISGWDTAKAQLFALCLAELVGALAANGTPADTSHRAFATPRPAG